MMWKVLLTVAALLSSACSTAEERRYDKVMDEIERRAQLPQAANPLSDYARFYGDAGQGSVVAVYMLPSVIAQMAAQECEELTLEASTPVPCVTPEVAKIGARERRWVGGHENLPFTSAPGCQVITFSFDANTQRFHDLSCVGHRPVDY